MPPEICHGIFPAVIALMARIPNIRVLAVLRVSSAARACSVIPRDIMSTKVDMRGFDLRSRSAMTRSLIVDAALALASDIEPLSDHLASPATPRAEGGLFARHRHRASLVRPLHISQALYFDTWYKEQQLVGARHQRFAFYFFTRNI